MMDVDTSLINWREKLDIFMSNFEHSDDVIGILVCGSYVTGNPTNHSDLDVHIILNNAVGYRARGNKIIDGLLIEYFANPLKSPAFALTFDVGHNATANYSDEPLIMEHVRKITHMHLHDAKG